MIRCAGFSSDSGLARGCDKAFPVQSVPKNAASLASPPLPQAALRQPGSDLEPEFRFRASAQYPRRA